MTRRMKSDQVRVQWRDVLDAVQAGETIIIERYNRTIGRIVPEENTVALADLNATIGRANESTRPVRDGFTRLAEQENAVTFTSSDLRAQVTIYTDASDGEYDVPAIVAEIVERHGAVPVDSIDDDEFAEIVIKHATG